MSNNQAEYETLLSEMAWVLSAKIRALIAYNDSQVVISKVYNDFIVHSENLIAYAEKVVEPKMKFRYFELRKLSRNKNEMADKLAKIKSRETPNDEGIKVSALANFQGPATLRS